MNHSKSDIYYEAIDTGMGVFAVGASSGGIRAIEFPSGQKMPNQQVPVPIRVRKHLVTGRQFLKQYFLKNPGFVKIKIDWTPLSRFDRNVLKNLLNVRAGET